MAGCWGKVNRQTVLIDHMGEFHLAERDAEPRSGMIEFTEALELLFENTRSMAMEPCRLEAATGRVLRQSVTADRAFPPFDRVKSGFPPAMIFAGVTSWDVLTTAFTR